MEPSGEGWFEEEEEEEEEEDGSEILFLALFLALLSRRPPLEIWTSFYEMSAGHHDICVMFSFVFVCVSVPCLNGVKLHRVLCLCLSWYGVWHVCGLGIRFVVCFN